MGGGREEECGEIFLRQRSFYVNPLKVYKRFIFFNFILYPHVGGKRFHDVPFPLLFQPPQKAVSLWIQVNAYVS